MNLNWLAVKGSIKKKPLTQAVFSLRERNVVGFEKFVCY